MSISIQNSNSYSPCFKGVVRDTRAISKLTHAVDAFTALDTADAKLEALTKGYTLLTTKKPFRQKLLLILTKNEQNPVVSTYRTIMGHNTGNITDDFSPDNLIEMTKKLIEKYKNKYESSSMRDMMVIPY